MCARYGKSTESRTDTTNLNSHVDSRASKNRKHSNKTRSSSTFDVYRDDAQFLCCPMKTPLETLKETLQSALDDVSCLIMSSDGVLIPYVAGITPLGL